METGLDVGAGYFIPKELACMGDLWPKDSWNIANDEFLEFMCFEFLNQESQLFLDVLAIKIPSVEGFKQVMPLIATVFDSLYLRPSLYSQIYKAAK